MSLSCIPIREALRYKEKAIRHITFDAENCLNVYIQGKDFVYAVVKFRDPIGFRVLNERDLGEFWDEYSQKNTWLYEVKSGGWLDLEKKRNTFISNRMVSELKEYFLADEYCISVFSEHNPVIICMGGDIE